MLVPPPVEPALAPPKVTSAPPAALWPAERPPEPRSPFAPAVLPAAPNGISSALLVPHATQGAAAGIPLVVNADSLATWVLPALAALPGITVDVVIDDQEHTLDRLRDGTAMAAISSDREPVQGCVVSPLGAMTYRPMASPAFVEP